MIALTRKLVLQRYFFIVELIFLTLITFNKNFFSHQNYQIRLLIYVLGFFYIFLVLKIIGFSQKQLGLTQENFLPSLKSIIPSTIFFFIIFFLIRLFQPSFFGLSLHYDSIGPVFLRGFYYSIVSVPVQELIFRSYVINRLEQFFPNRYFLIGISALIFSLVHWPFGSLTMVIGTFILGTFLSANFLKYRNIFTPILIHSLVGLALMLCVLQ
jgi:membrane protease YdiL (CAAX protease family)